MGGFDAGALLFKIQSVGAAVFKRDMDQTEQSFEKVERSARKAAAGANELGNAQDNVGKKAKAAKQGLDEQGRASETLAQKTARLKREQAEAARAAEKQADAAKKLSAVLLTVGVATSAMLGVAVAKNTEFDAAMSNVRAATMATVKDQERLGEAALKAGADTAYSAREAANAEEELAKAGLTVDQIVGGSLNGSLALAAAGQLQVARSAEIMATTLTQFRLPAEQAAHVSDVLAAGAGKAQGSVDDLALALSYVGPLAGSVGFSLNETAGTIAYFATQGIIGEKAGTSLRGVLASLQAPSAAADKEMQRYSISMFDANGNMLSLSGIAEQLRTKLGGLTEQERLAALGRIFGNESLNAATLLYEGGAAAVDKWTTAVDDSGYAAEQAAIRQDNLAGDIEKLGGAFDTALIRTGSGANDVLREMTQIVTGLVDWYGELPAEVQSTALVLGVATAAVTLFAGAAVFLRVKFADLRTEMQKLNGGMKSTALIAGGAGLALTGVLAVVGVLAAAHADAKAKAESYADAIKQGGDAAKSAAREIAIANLQKSEGFLGINADSAYDAAKKLGLAEDLVTDAALGNKKAMEEVARALDLGANGSDTMRQKLDASGLSLTQYAVASEIVEDAIAAENTARDRASELVDQEAAAKDDATEASKTAAEAYLEEADATGELESQLRELIDTMMEANGQAQDAEQANAAWRKSLADIGADAKDAGTSLDANTVAGSANRAMLAGVAGDAQKAAEAQRLVDEQTMSATDATDKYNATLAQQRDEFIKTAVKAGFNKKAVTELADSIFGLPDEKAIDILAETTRALDAVDQLVRDISQRRAVIMVDQRPGTVVRPGQIGITEADGGNVKFYANGNENHQAQYAKAGTWRVWAEPETGGEWYLPDAPAKRSRSLSLAAQMVDGWGYQLTPKGAEYFASGGVSDTVRRMRSDWATSQRRGENRYAGLNGNGFSLVDELLAVAEESSKKAASRLRKEALRSEGQFKRLEKAGESAEKTLEKAKDKLNELKDSAASMASNVASQVRRLFNPGSFTDTTKQVTQTRKIDGVDVTTLSTQQQKLTAGGIAKSMTVTAGRIKRFADKLASLAQKGLHPKLLEEVASLGVEEGDPVAEALLKATPAEFAKINTACGSIGYHSRRAGAATADANYADLIATAEKQLTTAQRNADQIRAQLTRETDRIIKAITNALKGAKGHADGGRVRGLGTSTSDSILRRLSNEEHVITAAEVDGAGGHGEVERQRALWARGIRGVATASDIARAGSLPATSTAGAHSASAVNLTIAPTFINPIVKDPKEDAWKTGLILGGLTQNGNTL